jgi:hypothetical protein
MRANANLFSAFKVWISVIDRGADCAPRPLSHHRVLVVRTGRLDDLMGLRFKYPGALTYCTSTGGAIIPEQLEAGRNLSSQDCSKVAALNFGYPELTGRNPPGTLRQASVGCRSR